MTRVWTLLFLIAALIGMTPVSAATRLSVTAVVHGGNWPTRSIDATLRAIRVDGAGLPVELNIKIPGAEVIELPEGNWELSIESHLLWSSSSVVTVAPDQDVSLDLWPVGTLRGAVRADHKGITVQDLRVRFYSTAESPTKRLPQGEAVCSLEEERWRCSVPAGVYDLRILSRGFVAEFRWNQEILAGKEIDLGRLILRRGASVVGLVIAGRGVRSEMKDVIVEARPRSLVTNAPRRRYSTSANSRGFFQIVGLPPGDYLIHAETKRFRSEDRPATVIEDRNAELRSPLILDWPRKIFASISPATTSAGNAWNLRLFKHVSDVGRMESVMTTVAEETGSWSTEVVPGQYLLQVGKSDGSVWRSEEFTVETEDVYLNLTIPAQRVVGSVELGDEPLANARLIFGGAHGAERETLVTDSDGRFSGEIPAKETVEKKWRITIDADDPRVKRTADYDATSADDGLLRFEIKLPRTFVVGRVLNEDGSAAIDAFVTLRSEDGSVFEQTSAGSDGHFEITGFEPGPYLIQAESLQRSSDVLQIHASETESPPVEIIVRNEVRVRGRIRSRSAAGVEASLTALPRDVRTTFVPTATTDGEGRYELNLPPGTRTFDLIVQAPGFALASGRVAVQEGKALNITVDQMGGALALEIPQEGDAIIRHDGAEMPARWLSSYSGGQIEVREGWGIVSLLNLEAGEYSVCVNGKCQRGVVPPHGTLLLSFRTKD